MGVEAWKQDKESVKWEGDSDVWLMGTGERRVGFDGARVELQEWAEYHVRAADSAKLEVLPGP